MFSTENQKKQLLHTHNKIIEFSNLKKIYYKNTKEEKRFLIENSVSTKYLIKTLFAHDTLQHETLPEK